MPAPEAYCICGKEVNKNNVYRQSSERRRLIMKRALWAVLVAVCAVCALVQSQGCAAIQLSAGDMDCINGGCVKGNCENYEFCDAIPCTYPSTCNTCGTGARRSSCTGDTPDPNCTDHYDKAGCGEVYTNCTCLRSTLIPWPWPGWDQGSCHNGTSCDNTHGDCPRFYCQ